MDVFVGDFRVARWQKLATISVKAEDMPAYSPLVFWSPDSSRFVVPEEEHGQEFLRVFEARTGQSSRIAAAQLNGLIVWEPDGRALFFSGAGQDADPGIFRVDATSGELSAVVRDDNAHLLAWHAGYARLVFYHTSEAGNEKRYRLFSCYADGSDLQGFGTESTADNPGWSISQGGKHLLFIWGEGCEIFN
jgi:Tol biopolymer transport system component